MLDGLNVLAVILIAAVAAGVVEFVVSFTTDGPEQWSTAEWLVIRRLPALTVLLVIFLLAPQFGIWEALVGTATALGVALYLDYREMDADPVPVEA